MRKRGAPDGQGSVDGTEDFDYPPGQGEDYYYFNSNSTDGLEARAWVAIDPRPSTAESPEHGDAGVHWLPLAASKFEALRQDKPPGLIAAPDPA